MFIDFRDEEGWETERERNMGGLPPVHAPAGDQTHNPGLCPDQKSQTHDLLVYGITLQPIEPLSQYLK